MPDVAGDRQPGARGEALDLGALQAVELLAETVALGLRLSELPTVARRLAAEQTTVLVALAVTVRRALRAAPGALTASAGSAGLSVVVRASLTAHAPIVARRSSQGRLLHETPASAG